MSGNSMRRKAVEMISKGWAMELAPVESLSEIYGSSVFSLKKMEQWLPQAALRSLRNTIETGTPLDPTIADVVAKAMKEWAISLGATHYAHVFYPLTGATAEKHISFYTPDEEGGVISEFSGKALTQGESDASSFPNGGLRSTFEARGYTVWDCSSPAYIKRTTNGQTLCIPTAFISWAGEALDKKTPVLRSTAALDRAARRVLSLLGHKEISPISSSCGAEQEYFLIDRSFYVDRPDLMLTGRTLYGAVAAKGQQFADHYFGAIPSRVQVFMHEVEQELFKLSVPVKIRHNEVAPGQFELAPVHETSNVATDHQQLVMAILTETARKHGFACLLHEKPFAGVNGSGKHVNWSFGNKTQGNLLDPGETPHENAQFLLFCAAVVRAVHLYGKVLRATIATASNDHRLGANEAPPSIISVYLGEPLTEVYEQICKGTQKGGRSGGALSVGVDLLPILPRDAGDRNRTSPFAFTGNRFEFRSVGAAQSVAGPVAALNTMTADSLNWIANRLEVELKGQKGDSARRNAVQKIIVEIIEEHSAVIFNGDGYSEAWHQEAVTKRKLPHLPSCAEAIPVLIEQDVIELFARNNVLSKLEMESRYEIYAEQYIKSVDVEAHLALQLFKTRIYPAAMEYIGRLSKSIESSEKVEVKLSRTTLNRIAARLQEALALADELEREVGGEYSSLSEGMRHRRDVLLGLMEQLRMVVDQLEQELDDSLWPLPTYQEMLFVR